MSKLCSVIGDTLRYQYSRYGVVDCTWTAGAWRENSGPEVIKLFACSVEHEILNADKYRNIKKFGFFIGSDKPRMLFPRS